MALDDRAIRRIVLTELARQGSKYVPLGISARHLHLSPQDLAVLFGPSYRLTPARALSQPGQFAAAEQVALVGPGGRLEKVRILGPTRAASQVEISQTDAHTLGIRDCPVRLSGQLKDTPGVHIIGPRGKLELAHGVIIAARHLHMSTAQAQAYGVHTGQVVAVRVGGERPCLLEGIVLRTGEGHELELHVDTDEANASDLHNGELLELLVDGEPTGRRCASRCERCRKAGTCQHCALCRKRQEKAALPEPPRQLADLVTERDINDAFRDNLTTVYCTEKAIITPAARDRSQETGIAIVRV